MPRLLQLLLTASLVAAAMPAVRANPRAAPTKKQRIVGVLDIHVEGVPPEIEKQFQENLMAQLDSQHYWLAPKANMMRQLANSTKWTEGCVIGKCLAEVKAQTNAELVLLAALTGSGTSFGYVVTLVRTDSGNVVAQEAERCDVCTVNEALGKATAATVKLLNAVPDKLPPDDSQEKAVAAALDTKLDTARHRRRVTGTALLVTGVVAAGAGVAAYILKDHANYGLATAAAGGGLILGGVVTLTF